MRGFSFGNAGIATSLNRALTGSGKSLLEQALYPKTDAGNRTFGPLLYGALYSGGTYLGFPKNYQQYSNNGTTYISLDKKMYNYPRRQRKIRVWSKKYRRYVWVYPRY